MDNNYLWDRSGEIDPDIQQLEEVLGTLRYQPRPFEFPAGIQPERRRNFFPALAIAAAIALFALTLAFWLNFRRQQAVQSVQVKQDTRTEPRVSVERTPGAPKQTAKNETVIPRTSGLVQHRQRDSARNLVALRNKPNRGTETARLQLTPAEQAEKERLLTALRLVSVKLNVAQRKAQGIPALNTIRNQHRIG